MSDFSGNVAWDLDLGLDAASALNGEHLVLGKPVVLDENSPNYLEPVEGRYFAVAPTKHLLTIGPTGSGKGVSLVIPNLLTWSGPAVVVDIGGQSAWVTAERRRQGGGKVVIVDPFGAVNRTYGASAGVNETVARFNPLSNLDPECGNYLDDVENLARALIVNHGGDPYWDEKARELVAGLIGLTMEVPEYRQGASLGLLRELLCQPDDVLFSLAARAMALGGASLAARKLAGFQTGSVEVAAVISAARTQTAFLDSRVLVENLAASDFSFDELLTANATVYLVLPPERAITYRPWLRLILSMAIRAVARGWVGASGRLPVLFVLDDFGAVGNVDAVESAFVLMRGFGVLVWAFAQSVSQLRSAYPKTWQTLFANVQAASVMGVGDLDTESYISKIAGFAPTGGGGGALAEGIRRRRPELCMMVRPEGTLLCRRIEYFRDNPFSGAARPDPHYKGGGTTGTGVQVKTGTDDLNRLIGLDSVKEAVRQYEALLKLEQLRGRDLRGVLQPYFVMTGNGGTGKTTVARIMGRLFKEAGYLRSDRVVEVDGGSLVADHIGETAAKTREVLESALDATLFIDEPYSLVMPHDMGGTEAFETILRFMVEHRGRLVVIVAGFEKEMRAFLNSDPSIRIRFTNLMQFPDYTAQECVAIFELMVSEQKLSLAPDVSGEPIRIFEDLRAAPHWSNGRDIRRFLEFALIAQGRRLAEKSGDAQLLTQQDLTSGFESLKSNKPGDWASG